VNYFSLWKRQIWHLEIPKGVAINNYKSYTNYLESLFFPISKDEKAFTLFWKEYVDHIKETEMVFSR